MDYICVLDFEATCDDKTEWTKEIIEFPSILYERDRKTNLWKELSRIQIYVKPKTKPVVSEFCEKLTGITQKIVDKGVSLEEAYNAHYEWIKKNVPDMHNFIFFTAGDWDLKTMLPNDLKNVGLYDEVANIYKRYVNVKDVYNNVLGLPKTKKTGMDKMLEKLDLELEGRHHSGIDDCYNIGKILIALSERDPEFSFKQFIKTVEY